MKHTPAPWFTHSNDESVSAATITPGFGNTSNTAVCSMRSNNPADAKLIASAPELLAALKEARTMAWHNAEPDGSGPWNALVSRIDAAIAKATGEQL